MLAASDYGLQHRDDLLEKVKDNVQDIFEIDQVVIS